MKLDKVGSNHIRLMARDSEGKTLSAVFYGKGFGSLTYSEHWDEREHDEKSVVDLEAFRASLIHYLINPKEA